MNLINFKSEIKEKAEDYLELHDDLQLVKCGEECCELGQAVLKLYNLIQLDKRDVKVLRVEKMNELINHITEETGDVLFMIYQVMKHLNISQKEVEELLIKKHGILIRPDNDIFPF